MLLDPKSKILLSVERAANDLRKGFPVIITENNVNLLVLSPETTSDAILRSVFKAADSEVSLIISANRLNFIASATNYKNAAAIKLNPDEIGNIPVLCGLKIEEKIIIPEYSEATNPHNVGLQLARIAELIPSVIATAVKTEADSDILSINANDIKQYNDLASYELTESTSTNLALKSAENSKIIAYRPKIGGKEHYAIIIGKPGDVPLVRVHSSCYTGDLLDSLECDCHDQLHTAIDLMNQKGGGIILYMLQEGRGIGLINKLRAYALKEQGFDTVDANEALGFNDDERLFLPAAVILKQLGISTIKLLTNNPKKAESLEENGIKVAECVAHIMPSNEHNQQYLKTKSDRLGHNMGDKA